MATNIRVVCRFRPQNSIEVEHGGAPIISVDEAQTTAHIKGAESNHTFTFDRIFNQSGQKEVFDYAARPVVEDLFKGYNGTIFVYGQTGSGKTFTMQGPSIDDEKGRGLIPRINSLIFETVMAADTNIEFLVKASYLEIYLERIKDLLDPSKNNLKVREEKSKGIWVEDATEVYVSSEQEVLDVIRAGTQNRAVGATNMNAESSRSHSLFILNVLQRNLKDGSQKSGKLYLVDLAGSEKVEKTGATGLTLDEAKMINKSLSSLGNVINALTDGKSTHVPYRDSKLTRILQESLGGNSRTTLIINCSPSSYNEAETLSTLRFGNRAKSIKNKAKVNQERSVTELKALLAKSEAEISSLQSTVAALQEEVQLFKASGIAANPEALAKLPNVLHLQEKITQLEEQVRKLDEEKQSLSDLNDELKEKESEPDQVLQLKEEINQLRANEQNLSQENELLIVKLADITIANEKLQYDTSENQLTIVSLQGENNGLKDELASLHTKIEQITEERNKASKMNSILAFQNSQEEDELNKSLDQSTSEENDSQGKMETQSLARVTSSNVQDSVESLKTELENHRREMDQLRREKQTMQFQLENLASLHTATSSSVTDDKEDETPHEEGTKDAKQLEKELHTLREQTHQKLLEFDALKTALFKDLENRCQKVIELEMLLDEAREQYQALLAQVKNSNSKALQQKCIFLQRNLEQLTNVQQQLVNENNKLKLDNQVYAKQLAIRNERIHGLELLLQDAQEKLQKYASFDGRPQPTASKKQQPSPALVGARVIKPIRGGGGGSGPPTTMTTPSGSKVTISAGSVKESPNRDKRATSIWDIFTRSTSKSTMDLPEPTAESPVKP